jgi:hypothetical protein
MNQFCFKPVSAPVSPQMGIAVLRERLARELAEEWCGAEADGDETAPLASGVVAACASIRKH